ncbi:helix-turn-helix domain-containing protein [Streptomyces cylindrosporus]|uniref:Helix-turn-helix domain-containing protein n=1 Tax=Streptomyces cylindrosporus TaxID=2927583 RepID=A0ABS9YHA8_9ACTN|nr:helix-turn-helix transcriptional regulator [Streptomyces cylindrosporus]MCI3276618.1 helix-turn-helix domain-containing protein [Streptomyces cylindrosporus]
MGQPKKKAASPAAQYFAEVLRLLRTAKGRSQNELGDVMGYSGAAVSAVETCAKPATDEFIEAAEKALGAGGLVLAAAKYLRLERYPEHFQGFVQLEQEALSVSSYCPQVIHGLLQTKEYAHALLSCAFPPLEDDEVEQLVSARMERRALLDRRPICVINIVIEEAALRCRVGGPEVMRAQYEYLLACAQRPNVVLQVMPSSTTGHAGLQGPLTVLETPELTTLVYMEGNGHSMLVSQPDEVGVLARRYAMISRQALRPEESIALIEQLAGEL